MKQDGAEKSWTKLFSIDLQKHFGGLVKDLMPLQSLKDGNVLLGLDMDSGFHIVSYDLKRDTTRILNVQEFQKAGSFHTSVFGESQVSLNTGTYLGEVYLANSDKEDDDSNDDSDDDGGDEDSDDDHYCFSDSADDDDDDSADGGDEGEGLQHNKKKSKKM
ncbi:hypothetical protein MKX03_017184 [Papaver bracteatum]|nr:hypothetical protein MKX03_017184 [Papaver bracteatum]